LRLDVYLVKNLNIKSRTKAQELIKQGYVLIDDKIVKKPSFIVEEEKVSLKQFDDFVSRAAYKLMYFLEETDITVSNKNALDIGSSTGGFSEILLNNNAKSVTCVDVGTNQLAPKIKNDKRVKVYEQTDIRNFQSQPFELVVSDVSFISLLKILEDIDRLSTNDIILLFKPQFEVGTNAKRDKNGVVKDEKAILDAMKNFELACKDKNWRLVKKSPAKITGKEGNLEYCYHFKK
jgi:23S rRNA (cytidine1920-2'-O)/16S rRNA (cytidine1409-2'-O)-methyltransferase